MLITTDETCMNFKFYNRSEEVTDSYTMIQNYPAMMANIHQR